MTDPTPEWIAEHTARFHADNPQASERYTAITLPVYLAGDWLEEQLKARGADARTCSATCFRLGSLCFLDMRTPPMDIARQLLEKTCPPK